MAKLSGLQLRTLVRLLNKICSNTSVPVFQIVSSSFQVLLSKALVYIYINNKRIYKYKNNGVVMVVCFLYTG